MSKDMATIYVMGKPYEVPKDLTIMKAMEYAGYQYVRGAGCRGGGFSRAKRVRRG